MYPQHRIRYIQYMYFLRFYIEKSHDSLLSGALSDEKVFDEFN